MVKISAILQLPVIRVLLFIQEKGEVRYADLARLIPSRGTLSLNLKDMEEEKLIKRRVVTAKPIQSFYSLTDKGKKVSRQLESIKEVIE